MKLITFEEVVKSSTYVVDMTEKRHYFRKEIDKDGDLCHYNKDGELHRTDGPAIRYNDGTEHYYIKGEHLTDAQFERFLAGDKVEKCRIENV